MPRFSRGRALGLAALIALASTSLACATGATIDGVGGAGAGGTAQSSGSGKTTGSSTQSSMSTSTQSSMSTASSMMSSSAADPNCSEQPCKLTSPQCGCSPDRQCSVNAMGDRECIVKGTAPIGASCGSTECVPGAMCVGPTSTSLSCLEFCDDNSDCTGPGGICYFTLDDGSGGMVPGVKLCSQNCDPTTNSGCASGLGCQVVRDMATNQVFTFCAQAGTGGDTAACVNGFTDCKAQFGCFNNGTSDICLQWCTIGGAACPGGLTCYSLQTPLIVGATEYGVCN